MSKATLEIRIKSIIKTGRKESILDKFYKSSHYTALWWLSRFFLYLISFVRNQVVGKKRSTTQIPSAAMLEPVLKYLESICTTYYVHNNWIRNHVLQWPTSINHALQSCTGPVQGQNRNFPVKFSTQRKPVFITWNPCSHCRDPVIITGIFLWELIHREIPVVITWNEFAV